MVELPRSPNIRFRKLNTSHREWRDIYHWLLTLSWSQFSGVIFAVYVFINVAFSVGYWLVPGCIAEMRPGSFSDAFFFSVETLATVGYGHMYPATFYGHVMATGEIVVGMFGLAVFTAIVFVRFTRPTARIVFSHGLVLRSFDGQPCLMFRVANLRQHAMVQAEYRFMFVREKNTAEGEDLVRFYPLKLQFDRLINFPAAVTIRHTIDASSPLHGLSMEDLIRVKARFMASVVCIDAVIPASVESQRSYTWRDIRTGHRFVEIYSQDDEDLLTVDYGRLHDTELMPE